MQTLEDPSFAAEVMRAKVAEAHREDIDTVAEEDGIEESLAWHRFTCDECKESPIVGCLYHCATIQNYDLCTSCYKKKIRPTHSFWLYSNPNNQKDRKLLPPQSEVTCTSTEETTEAKVAEQDDQNEEHAGDNAPCTATQEVAELQEQDEDASSKKNDATEPNVDEGDDQNEECNESTSMSSVTQEYEVVQEKTNKNEEASAQALEGDP
mmetsp:Transcript_62726/g.152722  ORF Transcript_62726/g.152722 Transcript_62726/m.152722 type:complete len:209 (+) Transcript_62726:320-946(+)